MKQIIMLSALLACAPTALQAKTITVKTIKEAAKPIITWVMKNKITTAAATITTIYAAKKIMQNHTTQKFITRLKLATNTYPEEELHTPRGEASKFELPDAPKKSSRK